MIDIEYSNEQTYTDIESKYKCKKKKDILTDQELYESVKYEKRQAEADEIMAEEQEGDYDILTGGYDE